MFRWKRNGRIRKIRVVLLENNKAVKGDFPRPDTSHRITIQAMLPYLPRWAHAVAEADMYFQRSGSTYTVVIDSVRGLEVEDGSSSDAMKALVAWTIYNADNCSRVKSIFANPDGVPDDLLDLFFIYTFDGYSAKRIPDYMKGHKILSEGY